MPIDKLQALYTTPDGVEHEAKSGDEIPPGATITNFSYVESRPDGSESDRINVQILATYVYDTTTVDNLFVL